MTMEWFILGCVVFFAMLMSEDDGVLSILLIACPLIILIFFVPWMWIGSKVNAMVQP